MSTNRLFFALLPAPEVREACARAGREVTMKNATRGQLTPPEQCHLTVLLIGDQMTDEDEAKALSVGGQVIEDPVAFTLDHASGCKEAKVWWLGMSETPGSLLALRARVKDVCNDLGLASDRRRFAPHVTIARGCENQLPATLIKPIPWVSHELVLVRSRLDTADRAHDVLGRWTLTGRKAAVPGMEQMSLL